MSQLQDDFGAACFRLRAELQTIHDEEQLWRLRLVQEGEKVLQPLKSNLTAHDARAITGITQSVTMPPNSNVADETAVSYDEKRQCCICKHTCHLSAVACACRPSKVVCLRHSKELCKCVSSRKYFLIWTPMAELQRLILVVLDRKRRIGEGGTAKVVTLVPVLPKQQEEHVLVVIDD